MSNKKYANQGLQIGTQNNQGGVVNNAGRDIIVNQNTTGASVQEFQSLLAQIGSQVRASTLSTSDKQYIEAVVTQVLAQSQKDKPSKNLILDPLKNIFELITQAAGAAAAATTLAGLLQKAITFAGSLF